MTLDPESAGLDTRQLSGIGAAVRNGRLRNLHGVVVMRSGRLVFGVHQNRGLSGESRIDADCHRKEGEDPERQQHRRRRIVLV